MNRGSIRTGLIILMQFAFITIATYAQDIIISLPEIPNASYIKDGVPAGSMVELYKQLAAHYTKGKMILLSVSPFERSIQNVIKGTADIHFPMILSPNENVKTAPYNFVSESLGKTPFILYTNAEAKPLDVNNLGKYTIEVTQGEARRFNFKVTEATNPLNSLKRVETGRIDGCILAQQAGDGILKQLKLKKIKRQLYQNFEFTAICTKGPKGDQVDKLFSEAIKKMKADKSLDKYIITYDDWQPAAMNW